MATQLCNYKLYDWSPAEFVFNTCLLCHIFLFNGVEPPPLCQNGTIETSEDGQRRIRLSHAASGDQLSLTAFFDIDLDCSHLSQHDCSRWRQCCIAADSCCKSQLIWNKQFASTVFPASGIINEEVKFESRAEASTVATSKLQSMDYCHPTWDGFSCFERASPGTVVSKQCPTFFSSSVGTVYKRCEINGTWFAKDGQPWTGYGVCVPPVSKFKFAFGLSLSSLSAVTLVLSTLTFLCYHRLRRQIRIRIHTHLFVTILLYNLAAIPNDIVFVVYGNQETDLVQISESYIWRASVSGMRFFKVASFSWMFCEGLFLLRLLKNGLKPPSRASIFYAIGWGFPVIVISVYYMTKLFVREYSSSFNIAGFSQERPSLVPGCDTVISSTGKKVTAESPENAQWMEWIIHLPCLITLAANYWFLLVIVHIMTSVDEDPKNGEPKLRRVPSAASKTPRPSHNSKAVERRQREQENTKKAARAIFLLSPLLGTYVLFTMLKMPNATDNGWQDFAWLFTFYELIQTAADRIQGFIVSIAFCLSTRAVLDLFQRSLRRHNVKFLVRRQPSLASRSSSFSNVHRSPSDASDIVTETSLSNLSMVPGFATVPMNSLLKNVADASSVILYVEIPDNGRTLEAIAENVSAEGSSESKSCSDLKCSENVQIIK